MSNKFGSGELYIQNDENQMVQISKEEEFYSICNKNNLIILSDGTIKEISKNKKLQSIEKNNCSSKHLHIAIETIKTKKLLVDDIQIGGNDKYGYFYLFLLRNKLDIYVIGANKYGQCGTNGRLHIINQLTLLNTFRLLNKPVKKMLCGHTYTLILTEYGEIYVWGDNRKINLDITNQYKPIYFII